MYTEGKARIKYAGGAFLNPKARVSREISVALVKCVAGKDSKVLDATAATGIRGIRYFLECGVRGLTLLEINPEAYSALKKNLKLNRVKAKALNTSIQEFANTCGESFNVIDLDPFGGVAPYVYDLMKVSREGTCLLATATDTAVLCGADSRACLRIYGARPMHNELCHEAGLRILIGYIARTAAQFNLGVEVMLSISRMHYMHTFVRLRHGAAKAHSALSSTGYAYYCPRCAFRACKKAFIATAAKCPECGNALEVSGPMWLGNIYDKDVVRAILAQLKGSEEKGALSLIEKISGELDAPFYYDIPKLTKKLRMSSVSPAEVMKALEAKGFGASATHINPGALRTDAPLKEVTRAALALKARK